MKTFKEFLLTEGINENNYRNWGFVSKNGEILDALLHPDYKSDDITNHFLMYAKIHKKFVDVYGIYGKRNLWYSIDPVTKEVLKDKPVRSVDSAEKFYKVNSGLLRWYVSRFDNKIYIDTPSFEVTPKMLENIKKLLSYNEIKDVDEVELEMSRSKNEKLYDFINDGRKPTLSYVRNKINQLLS